MLPACVLKGSTSGCARAPRGALWGVETGGTPTLLGVVGDCCVWPLGLDGLLGLFVTDWGVVVGRNEQKRALPSVLVDGVRLLVGRLSANDRRSVAASPCFSS